jgi:nucleoside-specific outer membrane channel protein Tsx
MKKYTFKGILLALGLVLATLSMQVGARDAGTDTDARADALWQTQLALTNAASTTARDALVNVNTVLDSNVDFSAQTAAVDALKWALVAFKVEIDARILSVANTRPSASKIPLNVYFFIFITPLMSKLAPQNPNRLINKQLNTNLKKHLTKNLTNPILTVESKRENT